MNHFESCGKCHSSVCVCQTEPHLLGTCLACQDGATNEGSPCSCGSGRNNTFPLCPCGNQGWDQDGSCSSCGGSVYAEGVKTFRPSMKPKPIPCHDHRPDGPDPYPNCKCSEIDKLFRSSGRARTPLLERHPPPAMLVGAQFDRIHKEVGRSRPLYRHDVVEALRREWQILRIYADRLEQALKAVQHGSSEEGPCWCMYLQVVHNDEGDKIKLYDGHTQECWQAQAVYSASSQHRKDLETPEGG